MAVIDGRLVDLLRASRHILIFTGAGVSTSSGIPDYRGPSGVWTYRRPVYYDQFLASEAARVEYWSSKLETWETIYRAAQPNSLHHAVVALEKAEKIVAVVTQNVDGLHRSAGTSQGLLIELHGTDRVIKCLQCGATSEPSPHFELFKKTKCAPRCPCGGLLKPATISFGQPLEIADLERAARAAADADLVLALGSTLSVSPAASIPLMAAGHGAAYIIVNRGPTAHDKHPGVTLRLEEDVSVVVPAAIEAALA